MQINVFISHSWSYSEHYERLVEWIFEESWSVQGTQIVFQDFSVPKDDPIHYARTDRELQAAIFAEISRANVIVIPTGMYANHSKWIRKEIDGAKLYRRPILAVNPWGQERKSSVVRDAADDYCGWSKQSVVDKILNLYLANR